MCLHATTILVANPVSVGVQTDFVAAVHLRLFVASVPSVVVSTQFDSS